MYKKIISGAVLCAMLLIGATSSIFAKPDNPKKPKANVTMEQAQTIALKKFPGTVESNSTQTVKGKEVYYFEIAGKNNLNTKVWVNMTGKIIKSEKEKPMKPEKKMKTGKMKKSADKDSDN